MSTSAPTHWTCQCGVEVPMGCSHTCGPFPPLDGVVRVGFPRLDMQLADAQAQITSLRAALTAEQQAHERTRGERSEVIEALAAVHVALDEVTADRDNWERSAEILEKRASTAEATLEARNREVGELREALAAMLSHGWWDGCDDDGVTITVCACDDSPPCKVVAAAGNALATTPPSTTGADDG